MIQKLPQQQIQDAYKKFSPAERKAFVSQSVYKKMQDFYLTYTITPKTQGIIGYATSLYLLKLINKEILTNEIKENVIAQNTDPASIFSTFENTVLKEASRVIDTYNPQDPDEENIENDTQKQVQTPTVAPTPNPVIRPTFVTKPEVSTPTQQTTPIAPTPTIPVPTKPTTNTPATPIQPQIPTILTPFMQEKPPVAIPEAVHSERDAILKEIEEPTSKVNVEIPVRPSADQQLSGIVFNPKEEKTVVIPSPQTQTKQALPQNMNRVGRDPYREAIE